MGVGGCWEEAEGGRGRGFDDREKKRRRRRRGQDRGKRMPVGEKGGKAAEEEFQAEVQG